ncbi:elongation factor G [Coprococcus sp. AF21-14LB]|uniref:elongation factor G n=1 Tax=Coprococcus sp. AF21-14LB TaxID=2292231 RepID=UPI000E553FA5|nr:elongation factor G [Coprococcus sp. AF21-14LB]QUO32330.1 elongation factor G [Faecalicatena sp. Marseille-Q4148]RGS81492.1 elongation factor G [Coprococcus sp. AF21-14LB]
MKVYRTDEIRNVVLLGHGGSGKTSLVEAMLYVSGATNRMGKITDHNTVSDFDKEEQKREFSISTSLIPLEWEKAKINILDTPGYFDFVGEVEEAVSAADAAIIVVSGKAGVQVGTEKAWELCEKYHLPRMIYVTEMDVDDASFREVVEELTAKYGKVIAPRAVPFRENEKLVGYVNIIKNAARRFTGIAEREECEMPDYIVPYVEKYREKLLEAVAETSEEFMERYFNGEEFSTEEVRAALRSNVMDGSIVPVGMGSNLEAQGVANLLSDIVRFFPSPDKRECAGIKRTTNEIFEANYDFAKSKSAYVFKTMVDPFIGKYSFIKVCSGVLKGEDTLYNASADADEKLGKLYVMSGNKPIEVSELHAGDIGAIAKLASTKTGDTLSTKSTQIMYGKTEYSVPYTYMKYVVKTKGDEDKVSQALAKMMAEDVTLKAVNDSENRQSLLYGMGDQHLEIAVSKLASRYKVDVTLETPKVAFRETIRKKSDVDSKYKKQSGGHGQYGHVKMRFEPSGDLETPYVFEEEVVGGAVPKNYFPAVEKGLQESVVKGPLAGYPVVGVKAVLYDGSYHPVDSSEMAFKTATIQAFKKGILEASPVLLEPIANLKVTVPDENTGDVMGDLNKRRGRVMGMNPVGNGKQVIEAEIPMTGVFGYCTVLRSMTAGRGSYEYEFVRYEQAPSDVQEKEIANRQAEE